MDFGAKRRRQGSRQERHGHRGAKQISNKVWSKRVVGKHLKTRGGVKNQVWNKKGKEKTEVGFLMKGAGPGKKKNP